jgi:hypothetical protein
MSCSGLDIFGDNSCEGGGGLTPSQEQDLTDVVEKTQNQDATAGNTNFSGVLTLNGVPVGGGGNPFIDPVIKTSVTIENDIAANTLVLTSSETTGFNLIESISGPLDINSTNLTINLNATLTENIGSNKLSTISGNMTELIAANKVLNVGGNNLSNASLHQITGPIVNNASLTTPILNGIDEIKSGGDININNPGGELIITNDTLVVNSSQGINMTGAPAGISLGANGINTTKTTFNNQELVTRQYVDNLITGYELIFAVTDQVSNITTTGQKFQIRAPKNFTISKFKLSLNSTAGVNFSVTLFKNGVSFSSVFLPSLFQDTNITESFLENDIISVNISNIGAGTASGLIVYLLE